MTGNKCKICGEPIKRVGNYYVCDVCGNKWEIDSGNDVHAVDRANAWIALRDSDFERAIELFEDIILKESKNHEAYWGRALAKSAIVYVTDFSEDKKVPTCNNITEESFITGKDVQKAISLAPADIAENYRKQAEQIEKIRIEWLEKARKEPAYDVFICYKDSDRENGLERTQDSIDAQDLYNALVAEGYKVFFSRISLRDKVAEQYEPYIYNAIRTAKVMIVFGEKPQYFSAVWLKNEWSRFKTRIEKGEKHKNSLVVVYKNMNPGDLPIVLKSRQCLNAADITFLVDLNRHIKKVIEASKQATHLEKIKIEGGQIAKKATTISSNTIQTRDVGKGAIAETSINEKQALSLAKTYLTAKQWAEAKSLIDDVLFNNPSYAEAIWCQILVNHNVSNNKELLNKLNWLKIEDYQIIEKVLNCADKDYAAEILNYLYDSVYNANVSDETYRNILSIILPYNFDARNKKIQAAIDIAIAKQSFETFDVLLATLESSEVDRYIEYNYKFAQITGQTDIKLECINRILEVNEGNLDALNMLFGIQLNSASASDIAKTFEEILKYSPDPNRRVEQTLKYLVDHLSDNRHCEFAKQLLKYYTQDLGRLKDSLIQLAYRMIKKSFFDDAQYILNLALASDPNNSDIYWGICLIKTKSATMEKIVNSPVSLKTVPEFNKYLVLVDEQQRLKCLEIAKEQESVIKQKEQERLALERQQEQARLARERQEEEIRRNAEMREARRKRRKKVLISVSSAVVAVLIAIFTTVYIIISNDKKARAGLDLTLSDDGTHYIVSGIENSKLNKYVVPESYKGKPVASIDSKAFNNCTNIKSIIIPDSVTYIGYSAFRGCSNLESLTIPFVGDSVKTSSDKNQYPFGYIFGTSQYASGIATEQSYYGESTSQTTSTTYYIPETLKSVTVTGGEILYGAFCGCTGLESITISDGVTSIGTKAFDDCTSLKSVTIPDSVTSIKDSAFRSCTRLTNLTIGNGVTSIGSLAFNYCSSLESITIPESVTFIGDNAFSNCRRLETVYWNATNCTSVGSYKFPFDNTTFKGCTALKTVIIGEYVKTIPKEAFYNCTGLKSVTIGNSVTSIGGYAFYECTSLKSVTIGNSLTTIGSYAFSGCESLESISIPDSVKHMGYHTFVGCTSLKSVTIGNSLTIIGEYTFYGCKSLESISIPDSVTKIDHTAFYNCTSLKSVTIGKGVTSIGYNAFYNCTSLETIYWNATNCKIDYYRDPTSYPIFGNCEASMSVIIGDGVQSIPEYAFYNCTSLESVTIGNSVTSIGGYAFYNCTGLKSLTIGNSVTSIGDYAFYDCLSLESITIPDSVTSIGEDAFAYCKNLERVTMGDSVTIIGSSAFSGCSSLESITIPDSVTSIGGYAFYHCSSLESITIPDSVTSIGDDAFAYCKNLERVTMGDSVTIIGSGAFFGCSSLESITIPDSVTSIGDYAFESCTGLTGIIIGNKVTTIGYGAFRSCSNLESITFPESVSHIYSGAFAHCDSLSAVYYFGTATQWKKIIIDSFSSADSYNGDLIYAPRYYYIEKEEDVPDDGGNYWHYVDGEIVVWIKEN